MGDWGAMDIKYFREFVILAQTLNFTETARRTDISQPALSKHIDTLERDFGTKLIDRSTRPARLTEAGRSFYSDAVIIADSYEHIRQTVKHRTPPMRMVRICSLTDNPSIAAEVGYATRKAAERDVRVVCSFVNLPNKSPLLQLRDGDADIALTFLSPRQTNMRYLKMQLSHEARFSIAVDKSNSLAQKESLKYTDLSGKTFVHLGGEIYRSGWDTISALLEQHDISYKQETVLMRSDLEIGSLDMGNKLFVITGSEQFRDYLSDDLVMLPLDEEDAVFQCYIVRNSDGDPVLDDFANDLAEFERSRPRPQYS